MKLNKPKIHIKNKDIFNYKIKEEEFENNEDFDNYDYLIKTLKINKNSRSKKDQARINTYLCNNIDYFKRFSNQIDEETLQKITGVINYKCFPSEYKIYSSGDDADKIYILLKGSISILKPIPIQKSMNLRDYVEYLANIRDEEKNEVKFKRIEEYNKKVNRLKLISIDYDYTKIPPAKEENYIVEEDKEVNILKEGQVFGEITLENNEKRAETVITKEKCDIVYLDRGEFIKLKTIEEQKINNKLGHFRNEFPIFKYWNNLKLMSLIKGLITEVYEKGDYIYKQNDKPENIYFLKEGNVEAFNHCKFNMYENFIEYIHDSTNSLVNDMDNPILWKEDKIIQKIEKTYEELEYLKYKIKKSKLEDEEEEDLNKNNINPEDDDNNTDNKQNLVNRIERINNSMKNYSYKANIQNYTAPKTIGYLEVIELKRRFCSIRCTSNKATIYKIPMKDFLLLIPTEKKNIFYMQSLLFDEKRLLIEQVKNNALAKLTFIKMNSLKKKIINLYNSKKSIKGNNNQFRFTKTLKFKNEPNFSLSSNKLISKNLIKSEESNNSKNNISDKAILKKFEILNLKKRLENHKLEDILADKFKNTMIRLNKNEFEIIKKLYPKKIKKVNNNPNMGYTNRNYHNNNYKRYLETNKKYMNNSYNLLNSLSVGDLTAKNYSLDVNLNYFKKRNNSNKKISFSNSKFLLPNIKTSKNYNVSVL